MYKPPFTISAKAINLVAQIAAQVERYAIHVEQSDSLKLRKANRIKTIYSSLAIEGNQLSEGDVFAILEGKTVIAPQKEILEVRNAVKAYDLYPSLNPFSIKDLLKAHHVMMAGLVDEYGVFRKKGVGVFDGTQAVHIAPPADRVNDLMNDLLFWLENSDDHLLIRSCVFHYEFEFIHPFADGNGRIGRLWQSLILGKLNPLFEHLPVENMVHANQQAYYDAISKSSALGECGPFIEFMLQEILNALQDRKSYSADEFTTEYSLGLNEMKVLQLLRGDRSLSAQKISTMIGITPRQVERILATLKERSLIIRVGANRNGYWEVKC